MKKLILICMAAMAALATLAQQSRVETDTIYSKVLNAPRAYTVYLPPSFDVDAEATYPVLYLLHGMWGKNDDWTANAALKDVADQLLRSGEIEEMVIITPDAGGGDPNVYQNGYINMPGWDYETFFVEEFMPQIEAKYRVKADKGHRATAGLSMGGGGCTYYAQHYPDLFAAAYAMSALMEIPKFEMPAGATPPANMPMPEGPMAKLTKSVMDNSCVAYVKEADNARKDALRSVAWFVDCGDDDFLLDRNIDFYQAMRNAKIPCELRVRDGVHNWEYWHSALYTCLPFVQRAFYRAK